MGGKVGENPAALRAAVSCYPWKTAGGGVQTPPSRAKVNPRPAGGGGADSAPLSNIRDNLRNT